MTGGYVDGGLTRGRDGTPNLPRGGTIPAPVEVVTDHSPRCWRCNRKLAAYLTRPWSLRCVKCHAEVRQGEVPEGADTGQEAAQDGSEIRAGVVASS